MLQSPTASLAAQSSEIKLDLYFRYFKRALNYEKEKKISVEIRIV